MGDQPSFTKSEQTSSGFAVVNAWYQNEWAAAWKPLAHVASIAVMQLALAPFAALAVPIVAVLGGSPVAPAGSVLEHVYDRTYRAFGLACVGIMLAILAFVPWVGLLVVPTMCLLLVRVFHFSFALGGSSNSLAREDSFLDALSAGQRCSSAERG